MNGNLDPRTLLSQRRPLKETVRTRRCSKGREANLKTPQRAKTYTSTAEVCNYPVRSVYTIADRNRKPNSLSLLKTQDQSYRLERFTIRDPRTGRSRSHLLPAIEPCKTLPSSERSSPT